MTKAAAMTRARDLRDHLRAFGVPVSIELRSGRSGGWNGLKPYANMGHHVASRRSQGLTPLLHLIKVGRSDLPGPLANGYLGFDGVARIITMDWANHPGQGGSLTVPGVTIPRNNGRPYIFGWECEGGYTLNDWPQAHRERMAACFAGTLKWMGRDQRSHVEHGTWAPGRKFDRIYYYNHLTQARNEVKKILEGGAPSTPTDLEASMLCSRGDSGPVVGALQLALRELGFLTSDDLDDVYGPKTADAVLAMRRSLGSTATNGDHFNKWAYYQLNDALFRHWFKAAIGGDSNVGRSLERANDTYRMHQPPTVAEEHRTAHRGSPGGDTDLPPGGTVEVLPTEFTITGTGTVTASVHTVDE
jgi:hypothetical protein